MAFYFMRHVCVTRTIDMRYVRWLCDFFAFFRCITRVLTTAPADHGSSLRFVAHVGRRPLCLPELDVPPSSGVRCVACGTLETVVAFRGR